MPTLATYDFGQLNYRDTVWSAQPRGASPWERLSSVMFANPANGVVLYDDFQVNNSVATNALWQIVKGTGGSITLAGPAGKNNNGWISIPTAASSNDYQCFFTQGAQYVLSQGDPIAFELYINLTEANTNASSWFCGLTSTTATGFLQNSGAPAASYSGAVFWKATGAMAVKFQTSNGATQNSTGTLATAVSGQSYILGMYLDPNDGVTAKATYYLSTVVNNTIQLLAQGTQNLTIASLAAMYLGFGVRAGSGSAETILCDYVQAYGVRSLL